MMTQILHQTEAKIMKTEINKKRLNNIEEKKAIK